MPRKPKPPKTHTVMIPVGGRSVRVKLHPPAGSRTCWYAYWPGLTTSRSTSAANLDDAINAAESMLTGRDVQAEAGSAGLPDSAATATTTVLTDAEFEQIQRAYFARRTDPDAHRRAEKTLAETLDAVRAFQTVSGLKVIAAATPDDCAAFQRKALALPKNWRAVHPKSKPNPATVSPNTVIKWCRCLHAAFERVNRNAGRKKCVRGIVTPGQLLTENPWSQFDWIEPTRRGIRQFNADELLGLLEHMEKAWLDVPSASAALKVFLWSGCRKAEVAGLKWDMLRRVGEEYHFEVTGKHGVERWFRVPAALYRELEALRVPESPFVFASYTAQITHRHAKNVGCLKKIRGEFTAANLGRWIYERVKEWGAAKGKGDVHLHVFRKTMLQHARRGEDINRQVAADARVGEGVMMTAYVKETDDELRAKSNRTFTRVLASLPVEVAKRYGYEAPPPSPEQELEDALVAKDWKRVGELSAMLEERRSAAG